MAERHHGDASDEVRYSDNPMMVLDFIPTRVSLPNSTQAYPFASPPSFRGKPWLLRQVLRLLPRSYYHSPRDRKLVAPTWVSISGFLLEIAACVCMFVGMVFYFYNHTTPHTTISITPLPGQSCSVLNPRRGTVHYNRTNSENAQFAGLYTTSQQQCEAALEAARVCEDGVRHDHLTLWGVTNPNNTQYYPPTAEGSKGFFSFTPVHTFAGSHSQALATRLVSLYGTSVSFPRPELGQTFLGIDTDWFVFNAAVDPQKGQGQGKRQGQGLSAFSSLHDVSVSELLYDAEDHVVYDPTKGKGLGRSDTSNDDEFSATASSSAKDYYNLYNLSTARVEISSMASPRINSVGQLLGGFNVTNLAVIGGVYYGVRLGFFSSPINGLATADGDLFVTDSTSSVKIMALVGGAVTLLPSSPGGSSNRFGAVASSAKGKHLIVAGPTTNNNAISRMELKDGNLTTLATFAADPTALAVDSRGDVYVTLRSKGQVFKIDHVKKQKIKIGTRAKTAFNRPSGIAASADGSAVYLADNGNRRICKITLATGNVTNVVALSLPLYQPDPARSAVALDSTNRYLYFTDDNGVQRVDLQQQSGISLVRAVGSLPPGFKTGSLTEIVKSGKAYSTIYVSNAIDHSIWTYEDDNSDRSTWTRLVGRSQIFSWDMWDKSHETASSSSSSSSSSSDVNLWTESSALNGLFIDSSQGACKQVYGEAGCNLLVHAEYSTDTGRLYVELRGETETTVLVINPLQPDARVTSLTKKNMPHNADRFLLAVFDTPDPQGTVYYTRLGSTKWAAPQYSGSPQPIDDYMHTSNYTKCVTTPGLTVLDASKIPGISGEPARYLLMLLEQSGATSMATFDTFNETFVSENEAAAATTHYMIAYTYGLCDGEVTRGLVELTPFSDYSTEMCQPPKAGLFYQSPNQYFSFPYECLGVPYEKLLTDCAPIKASMKTLVDATCHASIPKICLDAYTNNPPFSCVSRLSLDPLSIISLAGSNTLSLSSFLAFFVAALLARLFRGHEERDGRERDDVSAKAATLTSASAYSPESDQTGVQMRTLREGGKECGSQDDRFTSAHTQSDAKADVGTARAIAALSERVVSLEAKLLMQSEQLKKQAGAETTSAAAAAPLRDRC